MRQFLASTLMAVMTFGPLVNANAATPARPAAKASSGDTTTPIQHLVVIFQENVSFDHYFGTYPNATNPAGEPAFTPFPNTPGVNGLLGTLAHQQPEPQSGQRARARPTPSASIARRPPPPTRITTTRPSRLAFDSGLMDLFPLNTGTAGPPPTGGGNR